MFTSEDNPMMNIAQRAVVITAIFFQTSLVSASTIWSGPPLAFSKGAFADPTLMANQDRITDSVWITRGSTQGLYNAFNEPFQSTDSPAGTMWALGTTDDLGSLTFGTWLDVFSKSGPVGGPPNSVGQDFVLHLVDDDIFIDLRMDAWGEGMGGGGGSFAYTRSTPTPIPEPSTQVILAVVFLAALNVRRRRPDQRSTTTFS